jgi:hypothetical protein
MRQEQLGTMVVNKFTTQKGVTRTLEVEVNDDNSIDIEFTMSKGELESYKVINLSKREMLSLLYYLLKVLLPYKFLSNRKEKKWKEKKEEEKEHTLLNY